MFGMKKPEDWNKEHRLFGRAETKKDAPSEAHNDSKITVGTEGSKDTIGNEGTNGLKRTKGK